MREATLKHGGTVVSDGWDDVAKNHLINFLVGTAKGFFFDGTIMLKSDDSENAGRVAELICAEIEAVGKYSIVQVVTDTCSVMKAAWKIIEAKFLWITCTCCGPHVLSLRQAPSASRGCRAARARAAGLRLGGRAQLVGLRRGQDDGARDDGTRCRRQDRLLP